MSLLINHKHKNNDIPILHYNITYVNYGSQFSLVEIELNIKSKQINYFLIFQKSYLCHNIILSKKLIK